MNRKLTFPLFICFALLALASCSRGGRDIAGLYPVVQGGKVGFINKSGEMKINPQFEEAHFFSEGLAAVAISGTGANATPNANASPFEMGGSGDMKWGYIDTSGRFVINPQFNAAYDFSDGLAAIVNKDNKLGYIDKTGSFVITPQFDAGGMFGSMNFGVNFHEGMAIAQAGDKSGFIGKDGKFAINPQFEDATPFYDGLAAVKQGGQWGYIDKKGSFVINPQYDDAAPFINGLALIEKKGKSGFIDKKGAAVINPQFDEAFPFSGDGLARVKMGDKWGFVDKTGKIAINPQFEGGYADAAGSLDSSKAIGRQARTIAFQIVFNDFSTLTFSDGLAGVKQGQKFGFIDKKGGFVINPQFDAVLPFIDGLAPVISQNKMGYIDKTGKYVWQPTE